MSSLAEKELSIGRYRVGKVRVLSVHAERAIHPRLGIVLGITLNDLPDATVRGGTPLVDYELSGLSGDLKLGKSGPAVGTVCWRGRRGDHRSREYEHEHQIPLICDLDRWRLDRIEESRDGEQATFEIHLWPRLAKDGVTLPTYVNPIEFSVPQEDWLQVLQKLGFNSSALLEIHFEPELAVEFRAVVSHLRSAGKRTTRGDYPEAILECRKALEELRNGLRGEDEKEAFTSLLTQAYGKRLGEDCYGILSRVKQLSAPTAHSYGTKYKFTRAQAHFLLRVTSALVALIGELSVVSSRSNEQ